MVIQFTRAASKVRQDSPDAGHGSARKSPDVESRAANIAQRIAQQSRRLDAFFKERDKEQGGN